MRILLFDIDGTLLNTGGAGQMAMEAALQSSFGVTEKASGIPYAGRTDFGITRDLFQFHGIEDSAESWRGFLAAYCEQLPKALAKRDGLILPGVVELLHRLSKTTGVELGLLTGNLKAGATLKLAHYDLDHHFDFGAFGDNHEHRDDVAREALDIIRRHFDPHQPDDVWVIGDTPADVQCARAINAKVVGVATGTYTFAELDSCRPDYLFDDFGNVQKLFELLSSHD
ncbi:MAG: haloacid dehalogenase-like hydrolase [Planctomycetota bacterium]|nr:haloacid dehalogenase-like hydrolase [Planctomycetota bacterium]